MSDTENSKRTIELLEQLYRNDPNFIGKASEYQRAIATLNEQEHEDAREKFVEMVIDALDFNDDKAQAFADDVENLKAGVFGKLLDAMRDYDDQQQEAANNGQKHHVEPFSYIGTIEPRTKGRDMTG